jgi:hypothetical protein
MTGDVWQQDPMKAEELTNPVVRAVVIAMRNGKREALFAAFSPFSKLMMIIIYFN